METYLETYKTPPEVNEASPTYGDPDLVRIEFKRGELENFQFRIKSYQNYFRLRNNKYLTAIKNLYKLKSLLQLDLQLAHDMISEGEYQLEIKSNPDKYIIDVHDIKDSNELYIIRDIINEAKLNQVITLDEVSEIFSIEPYCLTKSSVTGGGSFQLGGQH